MCRHWLEWRGVTHGQRGRVSCANWVSSPSPALSPTPRPPIIVWAVTRPIIMVMGGHQAGQRPPHLDHLTRSANTQQSSRERGRGWVLSTNTQEHKFANTQTRYTQIHRQRNCESGRVSPSHLHLCEEDTRVKSAGKSKQGTLGKANAGLIRGGKMKNLRTNHRQRPLLFAWHNMGNKSSHLSVIRVKDSQQWGWWMAPC